MDADANGVRFHVAFSDHEHGVDFHLLGALNFAPLAFQANARRPLGSGTGHEASRAVLR